MDHSQDPCPWMILSNFGGAFSMGVKAPFSLLLLYQSSLTETATLVGYRWSRLARCKGLPKLSPRRTTHRGHHRDQSTRTSRRGEFCSMGWAFRDV